MVICSQLLDNDNTSVTNMAEYLASEMIEEHEGEIGEYSLVRFSAW
jgi:hypothetical protein